MDFIWENQDRRLQGVDVQTIQTVSPTEIAKEFSHGHTFFDVYFQSTMEIAPPELPNQDEKLNM
jgi:hypothetical protein